MSVHRYFATDFASIDRAEQADAVDRDRLGQPSGQPPGSHRRPPRLLWLACAVASLALGLVLVTQAISDASHLRVLASCLPLLLGRLADAVWTVVLLVVAERPLVMFWSGF